MADVVVCGRNASKLNKVCHLSSVRRACGRLALRPRAQLVQFGVCRISSLVGTYMLAPLHGDESFDHQENHDVRNTTVVGDLLRAHKWWSLGRQRFSGPGGYTQLLGSEMHRKIAFMLLDRASTARYIGSRLVRAAFPKKKNLPHASLRTGRICLEAWGIVEQYSPIRLSNSVLYEPTLVMSSLTGLRYCLCRAPGRQG